MPSPFLPSTIWKLRTLTVVLATAAMTLAGCSGSSSRELRTPAQAAGFVAEVASGGPYGDWSLASDASQQAVQAWAARTRIDDLGRKLRSATPLLSPAGQELTWTCVMAHELIGLGTVGGITSFNNDDVGIVTKQALQSGVEQNHIPAMIHDASTVPFRDLALATSVVCGPPS
jgi:hypothetical protein